MQTRAISSNLNYASKKAKSIVLFGENLFINVYALFCYIVSSIQVGESPALNVKKNQYFVFDI